MSFKSSTIASLVAAALFCGPAIAADDSVEIHIEAMDLGAALNEFGLQSGNEILFVEAETEGKKSQAVDGEYSPDQAVEMILADSGVDHRIDANGMVLVGTVAAAEVSKEVTPFLVAEADVEQADTVASAVADADVAGEEPIDVVTVTGTRIRGASVISPSLVITREIIENRGYRSIEEILRNLPQNNNNNNIVSSGDSQSFGVGTDINTLGSKFEQGINLRGLGAGATLVLVDGRRISSSATSFWDVFRSWVNSGFPD